jgi:hypothetical protein
MTGKHVMLAGADATAALMAIGSVRLSMPRT